jgi:acyl-CoA synthetase (AMP-forming)/AMP-acid ligase II
MSGLLTPGARVVEAATGQTWTGDALDTAVACVAAALEPAPAGAVLCLTRNDAASVLRYLGVLAAQRPAILVDPGITAPDLAEMVQRYEPAAVLGVDAGPTVPAYGVTHTEALGPAWFRSAPAAVAPHDDLRLLLATSGSTGRPRLVRQSAESIRSSAVSIRAALDIDARDVAITSLPLFYTLGLSVLHSHLLAGATVVAEGRGVLDAGFWDSVDRYGVSTVTGVPHTYELLVRRPWSPDQNPSVRVLTVSGGRLRDAVVTNFHAAMEAHGGAFYVMYGQTEAGSRICVLPPEQLPQRLGSVGPPVPGMRLSVSDGEVVCHSATVMMGYADNVEDLGRGDDVNGRLRTGDRGRLDDDGYLWLSGRSGRIGKAYGVRVSLDAVEQVGSAIAPTAAVAGDDRVLVWCEGIATERLADVAALVSQRLRIHHTAVRVAALPALPRRPNGKVDYDALPV